MSDGRSRMNSAIGTITASATAATASTVVRQPKAAVMLAISGRNRSWPVAAPPERTPVTSPRRAVNQRAATVAASTVARKPVAPPTRNPHSTMSCQDSRMNTVEATPTASRASALKTERRSP
jgi:hypothetical protein